ncbi:hypothetical protein HCA61_25575 [Rhodococcus sp. HNM0563]|uniref:hypothetical protein n=1 Tax=unclassified Rhodococcus (in: high G+C Gram-positive bacteria) TaxID=192944 RepID=UPI00146B6C80|nr:MULTISPECIES: hypothetical protein [unclassified Rhodococcus (in: high G+C Gram-positive bacteria)]MCK0093852.1 hypothetical protein [Rhodococcus sp. F64268]NLU65604.1 hypothetical protein [Rhodococcus sp. HNM0563]
MSKPTPSMTARYEGRNLEVSGPHRIYPSGLWYFRSADSDPAPTWIPAGDIREAPGGNVRAGAHDRRLVDAVAQPLFVTGLSLAIAVSAWVTSFFEARLGSVGARPSR